MDENADVIEWPQIGDKLLVKSQPPFYLPDTHSVRIRDEAPLHYATGYKKAAMVILHELQETCSELLVFPFISLWRHHIELSLKNLILLVSQVKTKPINMEGHNLPALWNVLDRLTIEDQNTSSELKTAFQATKEIIREFEKLDPEGQGSRYAQPRNTQKPQNEDTVHLAEHLKTLPRHFDFNHFAQILNKVSCLIDCLWMQYVYGMTKEATS